MPIKKFEIPGFNARLPVDLYLDDKLNPIFDSDCTCKYNIFAKNKVELLYCSEEHKKLIRENVNEVIQRKSREQIPDPKYSWKKSDF